jgi:hypothetical protein
MMPNVLASPSVTARRDPSARGHTLQRSRDQQRPHPEVAVTHPERRPLAESFPLSPNTTVAASTTGQGLDSASVGGSKSP